MTPRTGSSTGGIGMWPPRSVWWLFRALTLLLHILRWFHSICKLKTLQRRLVCYYLIAFWGTMTNSSKFETSGEDMPEDQIFNNQHSISYHSNIYHSSIYMLTPPSPPPPPVDGKTYSLNLLSKVGIFF